MRITDVKLSRLHGVCDARPIGDGERQAQMLDVYTEFRQRDLPSSPHDGPQPMRAAYVTIETDEGQTGCYGPIFDYQAYLIATRLKPFLMGRDPAAIEQLNDQMLRLDRHGRSGMFVTAISAVDCALWDLKGRSLGSPVHALLGQSTRQVIPAYASMLGYSVDPDRAAEAAQQYRAIGYSAQKWFFRYGPGDGERGMGLNIAMARAVRAAVGDDYQLMFDAYMAWDDEYAIAMARKLAAVKPAWLEEPVPPERVSVLRKIRRTGGVPIATGEHVYTRWQVLELLAAQAVDVIQTDPDWTGGITQQRQICALAATHGLPVVAHGHALLPALNVAASQPASTVPMIEYLMQHQENMQHFHQPIHRPHRGVIALPPQIGLGFDLDETKITKRRDLTW